MLNLSTKISSGRFRDIYLHPMDENKLVKILSSDSATPEETNTPFSNLINKFHTIKISALERELAGIDLINEKGLIDSPYFTQYFGKTKTNYGTGIIVERIDNFYFHDSKTVYDYLCKHKTITNPNLKAALKSYFNFLIANKIYCAGGAPENIAIIKTNENKLGVKAFDVKVYPPKNIWARIQGVSKSLRRIKKQYSLIIETDWNTQPYFIKQSK